MGYIFHQSASHCLPKSVVLSKFHYLYDYLAKEVVALVEASASASEEV